MWFLNKELDPKDFFPNEYVDIHSHLLPGIDDGAKDMEDSLNLIEKMASYGIKNIITTPHILGDVWKNNPDIILRKLKEVQQELIHNNIDVKIRAAAEYMLDDQFLELLDKKEILTLKDNYILVELSYMNPPINLLDIIFEIKMAGYIPVLAHPERYAYYHDNYGMYIKLKQLGCKFQLNLLSLTPQYGSNVTITAKKLLKEGMYNFAGTDTHHKGHLELLKKVATKKNAKHLIPLLENNKFFL
ncbi:tyrosine-protein phosphatase [Aureivirga sp. CE67]|uniref:tyrosine-protein phosphatase n=1 Tax=Aureivirga sp. CE67 TaxID=1788983 RepID=UPI0018C9C548|nr:CpsB/CapC family capsule biosynthesis tyrosine phosphatase [Aureivirga sp. CE67]